MLIIKTFLGPESCEYCVCAKLQGDFANHPQVQSPERGLAEFGCRECSYCAVHIAIDVRISSIPIQNQPRLASRANPS